MTSTRSSRSSGNPLSFLGLKRVGEEEEEEEEEEPIDPNSPRKSAGGVELNRRGLPARKRKRNSLIYGSDDLVSIPVKSPRKKGQQNSAPNSPSKKVKTRAENVRKVQRKIIENDEEDEDEDYFDDEDDNFDDYTPVDSPDSPPPKKIPESPSKRTPSKKSNSSSPVKSLRSSKRALALTKESENKKPSDFDLELTSPEKKSAQLLGVALRNLLKLPKAHKWVCYEFFYSNIDRVLFEGENDFMVCLRESLPNLKTRRLTRVEWCKIRRMMGKPRRCSAAFFAEERAELSRKRYKIRLLQQRKQADVNNFKDLPENIPMQLTIGTRVTARLRKPQDGLFTGTVDAYDPSNNTYRITFDRTGLGTHSIPDFEVLSTEEPEMMPLTSFTQAPAAWMLQRQQQQQQLMKKNSPYHHQIISPMKMAAGFSSPQQLANDPLLSGSTPRGKVLHLDGQIGGYPIKFLEQIVRLSKCLSLKRDRVKTLKELNTLGEKRKSFGEYIHEDFQRKYAATVLDLSQINRDLNEYLGNIREYTQEFSSEAGPTISLPNIIREGCQEDAYDMVNKSNSSNSHNGKEEFVDSPKILALISSLTALMLQVKHLADNNGERNAFELQALQESISEIKQNISSSNVSRFENFVEVHLGHIQTGLSQMGNLHAFMKPSPKATNSKFQVKLEKKE